MSTHFMSKRRHVTLSLTDKMEVIKRLDSGEKLVKIAEEFKIGKSTVSEIKKKRQSIIAYCSKVECDLSTRKTLRPAKHPEVEQALYEWYLQQRSENTLVTGDMICDKARFFYKVMTQKDDFRASKGWIDHFKKRFGIKLSALKSETVKNGGDFKSTVEKLISDYDLLRSQVYYVDEAFLFWKSIPNSFAGSNSDHKNDRVSFVTCCNADGSHKLNVALASADQTLGDATVKCFNHKSILMRRKTVSEWFHQEFVPQVNSFANSSGLPEKALLLIDNYCFDLPMFEELKSEDDQIRTMFLPPYVTKLNRPLEQTLNHYVKLYYKKTILDYLLTSNLAVDDAVEELTFSKAIDFLKMSWNQISQDNIDQFWSAFWPSVIESNHFLHDPTTTVANIHNELRCIVDGQTVNKALTFDEVIDWANEEDKAPCVQSDIEIVEKVKEDFHQRAVEGRKKIITNEEAMAAFDLCLEWADQNRVLKSERIILKRLRDKAANKNRNEITITPVSGANKTKDDVVMLPDEEEEGDGDRLVIDEGRDQTASGANPGSRELPENVPECQGCHQRSAQFVCAGCGNQWYCSRECQVTAWEEHSEMCSG